MNNDSEQKKDEAFKMCIPVFQEIQIMPMNANINDHVQKLLSMLNIDTSVKDIINAIIEEIQTLKSSINSHSSQIENQEKEYKTKIGDLEKRLNDVEMNSFVKEIEIDAYEIVQLFKYYYIDDIIRGEYPTIKTWNAFMDEWSKREMQLIHMLKLNKHDIFNDQVQQHQLIQQFLSPIEIKLETKTGLSIKLLDLRKMSLERHSLAHHALRTIADQRMLINKYEEEAFPDEYHYKIVLKQLINFLQILDCDPTQTKLRRFH